MKIHSVLVLVLMLASSNGLLSQSRIIHSMDSVLNVLAEQQCFNGDAVVAVENRTVYQKSLGYRDNVSKDPIQHDLIFNIGSVSKPFTSVAILQLHQQGLLDVNSNVLKYLPEFPYDNISVKHLLSHTSGLKQNFGQIDELDADAVINNDSIIPILTRYRPPLFATPGSEWIYSNIGYEVLALIVERVSSMPFSRYMKTHVFEPAQMQRTFVPNNKNILTTLPKGLSEKDLLVPHEFKTIADCEVSPVNAVNFVAQHNAFLVGSEQVYSCVNDLVKFDLALRNNVLLSQELQQLAYTPFVLANGDTAKDLNAPIPSYIGLGWYIAMGADRPQVLWHKGRSHGSRSVFLRVPEKQQVVAVTDNFDNPAVDLKGIALLRILNDASYRNPVLMSLVQKLGCEATTGDVRTALTNFEHRRTTARQHYYISEEEMVQLSQLLLNNRKIKEAISIVAYAMGLFPNAPSMYSEYAKLMWVEHSTDSAKVYYRKAVDLSGEGEHFLNGTGYYFFSFGSYDQAEFVLKLNTELYPNSGNVFDSYALVLDKNGKLREAIQAQEKAVSIATANKDSLLDTFKDNLHALHQKEK